VSDENATKLDSKMVELLKLLQRFGQSVTGLLILEIGWTSLLVLASKLVRESDGIQRIGNIPLDIVWLYGAIFILIGWIVYSRLYAYLVVPAVIVLKPVADFIFAIFVLACGVFDSLRNRLIAARRQRMIDDWLHKHRINRVDVYRKKDKEFIDLGKIEKIRSEEELNAHYDQWLEALKKDRGNDVMRRVASDEIPLKNDIYKYALAKFGKRLLTPLHSGVRVGIAPLINYSSGHTLVSLRSPLEQFGGAIANVISRFNKIEGMEHVHFYPLPSHFPVRTHARAEFAVRLFNLDALVWGQLNEDQRSACVQVLTRASLKKKEAEDTRSKRAKQRTVSDLFPIEPIPNISTLRFAPSDDLECHIVLVVAVLESLESYLHEKFRWDEGPKGSWAQLTQTIRELFTAFVSPRDISQEIFEHLARDIVPLIREAKIETSIGSPARIVAVDLVSRWIGTRFRAKNIDRSDWRMERFVAAQFHEILSRCVKIHPNCSTYYFRLGALSCLLGESDRAREEFIKGGKFDAMTDYSQGGPPSFRAQSAYRDWANDNASEGGDLLLARFAAHASAAIFADDDVESIEKLVEQKPNSLNRVLLELHPERAVALNVVKSLLKSRAGTGSSAQRQTLAAKAKTLRRPQKSGRR
jgi:hypothetical protein